MSWRRSHRVCRSTRHKLARAPATSPRGQQAATRIPFGTWPAERMACAARPWRSIHRLGARQWRCAARAWPGDWLSADGRGAAGRSRRYRRPLRPSLPRRDRLPDAQRNGRIAMCGLSVILSRRGSPDLRSRLGLLHAAIPHRGPDGEGFLLVDGAVPSSGAHLDPLPASQPRLGMAFRRLKICDLSDAAQQPMGDTAGKTWLVFNGEIYNFRELRAELEALGHVFRTHGDTEVVLEAYRAWGEACFARFEGMWAIVVLDLPRNRLVLSRDRFGIKPLHWMIDDDGDLAARLRDQAIPASRPRPAVEPSPGRNVPAWPALSHPGRDILRRRPAHAAGHLRGRRSRCASRPLDCRPYWQLSDFTASGTPPPYSEAVDRAEDLLARAVASHRQADVKVGALLSGGVDSSTLVGLACRDGAPSEPIRLAIAMRRRRSASCRSSIPWSNATG